VADRSAEARQTLENPYAALPGELYYPHPEPPKVRVKADLLPGFSLLCGLSLLGIPLGLLWAAIAPPQRMRVFPGNELIPLQNESWHRFDDLAIFALLGFGLGLVTGAVIWLARERRGPVILFAAVGGSALAAWLSTMMGKAFTGMFYAIDHPPAIGDVIRQAPQIESYWALLAQPLAVAMAYGLLAAWNGRDDLGRRLG
jgi:hypothetical protein